MRNQTLRLGIPLLVIGFMGTQPFGFAQQRGAGPLKSVRLYILDCGTITGGSGEAYNFKPGELATTDMVTPCYLIVHPRGTLMWDTGEIADKDLKGDGAPTKQGTFTVNRPLLPQLAAIGYSPADITYLALSHYHTDHVANAAAFAGSTWIVQRAERDAIFAPPSPAPAKRVSVNRAFFTELEKSKTLVIQNEDHDVFGDGTVVIRFTPGHTPGHQSLFLRFAKTGPVLLSGDLYHYPEELTLKRIPTFDFDEKQTARSRADIEDFLKKTRAQLWIQHDTRGATKLKKSPEYYE
jgi:glyoxylase-like metal-dependent hydrolase (beta-lactamase superfamily II)